MAGFGVDLGTGYARASVLGARGPELVREESGALVVPALVSVETGGDLAGEAALFVAATRPDGVARAFVRALGRTPERMVKALSNAPSARRTDGGVRLQISGQSRDPEDLAATLISHLVDLARAQTGAKPSGAVFTMPLWFDANGRAALESAAKRAGVAVEGAISEAHAAALALPEAKGDVEKRIVIVDVGAGGFSVSVLAVSRVRVVLRASRSEEGCGGDAVDRALCDLCLGDLGPRGVELARIPAQMQALRRAVEAMKRELGDPRIDEASRSTPAALTIDRDRLDRALGPTLERMASACEEALAEAELGVRDIDTVYAGGGMTQVPSLRARVGAILGRRGPPPRLPEGVAAMGAALYSQALAARTPIAPLEDQRPSVPPPPPLVPPTAPPARSRSMDVTAMTPSPSDRAPAIPRPPRPMASPPPVGPVPRPPRPGHDFVPAPLTIPPGPGSVPPPPGVLTPPPPAEKVWSVAPSGEVAPAPGYVPPSAPAPAGPRAPFRVGAWSERPGAPRPPSIQVAAVNPGAPRPPSVQMAAVDPAGLRPPTIRPPSIEMPAAGSGSRPPTMRPPRRPLLEDMPEGSFRRPADAAAYLAQPGARPLVAHDLESPTLLTLLVRVVADARVNGVLTFATDGQSFDVAVQEGRALVTQREQNSIVEAFVWPRGTYRFEAARVKAKPGVKSVSMVRLAAEGLRVLARSFDTSALDIALAAAVPMNLAPQVRADKEGLVGRLGLNAMETRVLENKVDGATSGLEIVATGRQGRQTTVGLVALLVIFEVIEWQEIIAPEGPSQEEVLAARAARMDAQDHFMAIGAHWSNTSLELDQKYRARCVEFAPRPGASAAVQEALARMRRRADVAYAVLRDPHRRQAYRREVYPIDYDAAADLAERRAVALAMRTDQQELETTVGTARELGRTALLDAKPAFDMSVVTRPPSSRHPTSQPPSGGAASAPPSGPASERAPGDPASTRPTRPPGGSTPPR